ncbi:transcriptional regulator [Hydrococcus rivularis NIES-593]|uniref:Transcriptional regulator n=1 Tax=Hydrococcus rivularis NIES-593 TaxID=1921803 RepID=A0A1U7HTC9_9CYAN|nr:response regulator [Hydrococcus rivularis]OKH26846.1 transcriptional regulator [Hydrococcus rivularis NIES-593]
MKILVVENDELTAKSLDRILSSQNYIVETVSDGETAWELIDVFPYDLIIVDATLPKLDGISLCKQIRSSGQTLPILLLTRADSSQSGVAGLDAGADDYLLKPIDSQELLARVRALLRRGSSASLPVLKWGDLQLEPSTYEVTYEEHPLSLTPKEYAILELFLRNPRRVFSCGAILDHLWEFEKLPGENAVRTHIKELRHKLKAIGAPADIIETVYGIGYRLKEQDRTCLPESAENIGDDDPRQQTLTGVAEVWKRFQSRIYEQLEVIEQVATVLLARSHDRQLQEQAEQEAHTLAGALGTFGLSKGSQLARKIEQLLQVDRLWEEKETLRLHRLVKALRREIDRASESSLSEGTIQPEERPFLLVVESDRQLAQQLAKEAESWGMEAENATSLLLAREILEDRSPNVVLLEPFLSESPEESFEFVAQLAHQRPPVPVLIFTDRDGLEERLEFVRSGGCAFLQKPMSPAQVLNAIDRVLHRGKPPDAHVMVVDDDPKILAILRTLLEPWGLKVTTLDDPRRFWETLEAVAPDLLILDLKMPHVNGIELCQVIRNDSHWGGLPIIVLTANINPKLVDRVFAAGADDFVSKPVVGPELIARIINRLERLKLLQRLAEASSHHISRNNDSVKA